MLRLAGELTDGTVLWLAGAKAVREYVAPRIRRAAANAGRPEPRIICGLPIMLTKHSDEARAKANALWGTYGRLPAYRSILDRQAAAGPAEAAIVGDESMLDTALSDLEEAGVTTFLGTPFETDEGAVSRTRAYLAAKAKG
jgi:alkanesulfonate monooxygenase SsuD/methylene tetrahydromethanopterin reductase-like flavin-dependent oxidoreductase (luciferase family)